MEFVFGNPLGRSKILSWVVFLLGWVTEGGCSFGQIRGVVMNRCVFLFPLYFL